MRWTKRSNNDHAMNTVLPSDLPPLPTISERLRWARRRAGMTQEQLADASGVSRDIIAKTERGATRMTPRIDQLAKALDVSPAWLAFGRPTIDQWDRDTLELAETYHQLPDDLKAAVRALIDNLHKT